MVLKKENDEAEEEVVDTENVNEETYELDAGKSDRETDTRPCRGYARRTRLHNDGA